MSTSEASWGTMSSRRSVLAPARRLCTIGRPPWERCAYPTASAPRSAMPASRAWAASVLPTFASGFRLYPAIPHIVWILGTTSDGPVCLLARTTPSERPLVGKTLPNLLRLVPDLGIAQTREVTLDVRADTKRDGVARSQAGRRSRRARQDSAAGFPEALRARDRRRAVAHCARRAGACTSQGRGRRGGQGQADRIQPPARDVHHPQVRKLRRPAARPDSGGEPGTDPRRREVRLAAGLQALDIRDVVDPASRLARRGRPGPDDPIADPRRRAVTQDAPLATDPHAEAQPLSNGGRDRGRQRLNAQAGA